MKIGAMMFATDRSMSVITLAQALEARGFESLWLPEKTHVPVSRKTPWPGGELPEWYLRTCDPFVSLASAISVTTRLRLGSGIALVPVRDAVITAKEVATLDMLSNGRFEFGVGFGWNAEELASHGVTLQQAPLILEDKIALMRALWRSPIAGYSGRYATVDACWSWPKPTQRLGDGIGGHHDNSVGRWCGPRIHLGSRASQQNFDLVARMADSWMPIEGYGRILEHQSKLQAACIAIGRDPDTLSISVFNSLGDPNLMDRYRQCGVERVILTLPSAEEAVVMKVLDQHRSNLDSFFSTN